MIIIPLPREGLCLLIGRRIEWTKSKEARDIDEAEQGLKIQVWHEPCRLQSLTAQQTLLTS